MYVCMYVFLLVHVLTNGHYSLYTYMQVEMTDNIYFMYVCMYVCMYVYMVPLLGCRWREEKKNT